MDPKRKKIYLIIIAICLVLSVGMVLWSMYGPTGGSGVTLDAGKTTPGTTPVVNNDQPARGASGNVTTGFRAPAVFPAAKTFDTKVLDSTTYKQLREYQLLDITGQLGRPDPFKQY